jgi:hypothetical protein
VEQISRRNDTTVRHGCRPAWRWFAHNPTADAQPAVVLHSLLSKPFCTAWPLHTNASVTSQNNRNSVFLFSPGTHESMCGRVVSERAGRMALFVLPVSCTKRRSRTLFTRTQGFSRSIFS